jgi:hypothetical protein
MVCDGKWFETISERLVENKTDNKYYYDDAKIPMDASGGSALGSHTQVWIAHSPIVCSHRLVAPYATPLTPSTITPLTAMMTFSLRRGIGLKITLK